MYFSTAGRGSGRPGFAGLWRVEFRGVFVTPANGANSVYSAPQNPFAACLIGLRPSPQDSGSLGHEIKLNKASLVEGERLARDDIDQGERRRDRREWLVLINQTIIQIRLKPHHHDQPVAR